MGQVIQDAVGEVELDDPFSLCGEGSPAPLASQARFGELVVEGDLFLEAN